MNGKYYGGGMKLAPFQDRNKNGVSLVIWHGPNKLKGLIDFPKIFKGEHIKNKKTVHTFYGQHIKVTFNEPCGLQIDGESIDNVTSYEVYK